MVLTMTAASGKLTARSASRHVRIVSLAAQGLRQNEIAREEGCSEALVSRLMRRDEIKADIEAMRINAVLASWQHFHELLDKSIEFLLRALADNLVERRLKAQIALKLLEFGLDSAQYHERQFNNTFTCLEEAQEVMRKEADN